VLIVLVVLELRRIEKQSPEGNCDKLPSAFEEEIC
jgi:hypothetical protein